MWTRLFDSSEPGAAASHWPRFPAWKNQDDDLDSEEFFDDEEDGSDEFEDEEFDEFEDEFEDDDPFDLDEDEDEL